MQSNVQSVVEKTIGEMHAKANQDQIALDTQLAWVSLIEERLQQLTFKEDVVVTLSNQARMELDYTQRIAQA